MAGKVKYHNLTENEKKKFLGEFYSMVAILRGRNEIKSFFKDLLTLSEITMISRRIQVAKMLLEEKSYEAIRRELKVGYSTINYVERWLNNGFGGYKEIINKYQKNVKKVDDTKNDTAEPFSHDWVRKKYPMHYFLSNLINKK